MISALIQVEDRQTWWLRLILVEGKDLALGCASFWPRIRTWPPVRANVAAAPHCG